MPDITLVLDRKKMVATYASGVIRIDLPGMPPRQVPLNMIKNVVVIGDPMVSCGVWRALAEKNIPAVLLPLRGKGASCYMGAGFIPSLAKRQAQFEAFLDGDTRLKIAKHLLSLKLQEQMTNLRQGESQIPELNAVADRIAELCLKLNDETNIHALFGYEGSAAYQYFKGLKEMIGQKWAFSGRNRRPPRDPVNSLLSLSYVLAGTEVLQVIQVKGLDPARGFLHGEQPARYSLMLDLIEPLRPKLDRFVLELLDNPLNLTHFRTTEKEGCRLTKSGRRLFYEQWVCRVTEPEEDTTSLRGASREVVDGLVNMISGFKPE